MAQTAFKLMVFDPLRLPAVNLDLQAVQRLAATGTQDGDARWLRAPVKAAAQHSRLYLDLLPAALASSGRPLDVAGLPMVRKAKLIARFDDWVQDPAIERAALQACMA